MKRLIPLLLSLLLLTACAPRTDTVILIATPEPQATPALAAAPSTLAPTAAPQETPAASAPAQETPEPTASPEPTAPPEQPPLLERLATERGVSLDKLS